MGFNLRPKIVRYVPEPLSKGFGILDLETGEVLRKEQKNRIERYAYRKWAQIRCNQLNERTKDD